MRIESICPTCGKHKGVIKETRFPKMTLLQYECGHSYAQKVETLVMRPGFKWVCLDCKVTVGKKRLGEHLNHDVHEVPIDRDQAWLKLYKYQREGIELIENANANCLVSYDTGLGKTAMALNYLRYNDTSFPVLIVCPAGITPNWKREVKLWLADRFKGFEWIPFILENTQAGILDGMKIHIVSNMRIAKPAVRKSLKEYGFKTIIVDEAHNFKNDNSKRTAALIDITKGIPHRILLTATPVMNRAMEIFNCFHLCKPERFPNKGYLSRMCTRDSKGKILSIAPWYKERFNEMTKDFVFRKTKKEVFADLPPKIINNMYVDLSDNKNYILAYNDILDELELRLAEYQQKMPGSYMFILALIQKMWQFTAIAKTPYAIEHINEFLNWSDEKIAIGTHHINPREHIKKHLKVDYACIEAQNPNVKQEQEDCFRNNTECRVLVASILGAGEGRNLQFCKNVVFLERFWNPAKETQFQDRFYIRGKNPEEPLEEKDTTIVTYILAENTIDEYFTEMVNLKQEIVNSVVDQDYFADEDFVMGLARKVVEKRLQYVGA